MNADGPALAPIWVMLETIAIVLLLLWILGFVTSHSIGGLIHVLLVVAVILVLVRVIQGKKILS